jgi:hypothetical protein
MRLSLVATVGAALSLALILSACGEDRTATADGPASTSRAATPKHVSRHPAAARGARGQELRGFLAAMSSLRTRLARGLSYDDYLREVHRLRSTYDRIDAGRLPIGCLLISGTPAERAFNLYVDAANAWGDCLATASCETAAIEPRLQHGWARASTQLTRAQRGLAGRAM